MSYPILTSKQVVVLETLAAMDKFPTACASWNVAWGILIHPQNSQYWDAGMAGRSLERSVVGVLVYLEREGLVKSYAPGHSSSKGWHLSQLGSDVAGVETSW